MINMHCSLKHNAKIIKIDFNYFIINFIIKYKYNNIY